MSCPGGGEGGGGEGEGGGGEGSGGGEGEGGGGEGEGGGGEGGGACMHWALTGLPSEPKTYQSSSMPSSCACSMLVAGL